MSLIVFSHANGFHAGAYRSLLSPLSTSLRIWAPNLRGHGASDLPVFARPKTSWRDHRDDLLALMETIEGPPPVLAGHSMGGRVALEVMRLAPERVERLALLDTGVHPLAQGEAGAKEKAGRMALLSHAQRAGMRAMGTMWARPMDPAPTTAIRVLFITQH